MTLVFAPKGTPENSVAVKFWVSVNREPKCYTETKLHAHVLVDFRQILVMKSDYDLGSVNEALERIRENNEIMFEKYVIGKIDFRKFVIREICH